MVNPIKVLVVDDDALSRKILRTLLEREADIQVAGVARDGESALRRIEELDPDLVTLDVEMPGMNGIDVLKEVRRRWPDMPVIMYSALTEDGASVTLDALSLGASDYVTKPEGRTADGFPLDQLRETILPKIRALCAAPGTAPSGPRQAPSPTRRKTNAPIDIVAIGVSTGGPNALAELIPGIRNSIQVPIVVVQHMPATFTRLLAQRLDNTSSLRVVEATEGEKLAAGSVYIAPGGHHMTIRDGVRGASVALNQGPKVNSCRPSVDVLFESVAETFHANTLSVVMTGMGEDGKRGCKVLSDAGGGVLIQDEPSSVVWGMPGAIAHSDIPHHEFPLSQLAQEINNRVTAAGQSSSWQAKSA